MLLKRAAVVSAGVYMMVVCGLAWLLEVADITLKFW